MYLNPFPFSKCVLLLRVVGVLYIFWRQTPYQIDDLQKLPSCELSLYCLHGIFRCNTNFFILVKSGVSIFPFVTYAFGVIAKKES